MEIREFALRILETTELDEKLAPAPAGLSDTVPGPAVRLRAPARSSALRIVSARDARVPAIDGLQDPAQRKRILHSFANHELQAVELYAWALLAFPDAPAAFRADALRILGEEQMHCRLYRSRLRALGAELGDFPVSGYFWNKVEQYTSPMHFACAMALTFENANLDHTTESLREARGIGDDRTAAVIEKVHEDERGHVEFGWRWLCHFKRPQQSPWEAYVECVEWPLRPGLGRGRIFDVASRQAAGLDAEFIERLEASKRDGARDADEPSTADEG